VDRLQRIQARTLEVVARACARLILPRRRTRSVHIQDAGSLELIGAVCILAPHPDDEVIGCFHFIRRVAGSVPVDLIYVTDEAAAPLAKIRRAESCRATSGIPIRSRTWWGYADGGLNAQKELLRDQVGELSGRYGLILCPAPSDLTQDHAVLAECAQKCIPADRLLWYRSTWLTFPLRSSDVVASGSAREKLAALREFMSQSSLALGNVVNLSRYEANAIGIGARSIEGFRFARSDKADVRPINALSIKAAWLLRDWL
jgi:hypothetical protein